MGWGHELGYEKSRPSPVTLPAVNLPDIDPKAEAAERAVRFLLERISNHTDTRKPTDARNQLTYINAGSFGAAQVGS